MTIQEKYNHLKEVIKRFESRETKLKSKLKRLHKELSDLGNAIHKDLISGS